MTIARYVVYWGIVSNNSRSTALIGLRWHWWRLYRLHTNRSGWLWARITVTACMTVVLTTVVPTIILAIAMPAKHRGASGLPHLDHGRRGNNVARLLVRGVTIVDRKSVV